MSDSEFYMMVCFSIRTETKWNNYAISEIPLSIVGFIVFERFSK